MSICTFANGASEQLCKLTSLAMKTGRFSGRPEAFRQVAAERTDLGAVAVVPATGGKTVAEHLGLVAASDKGQGDSASALMRACERLAVGRGAH